MRVHFGVIPLQIPVFFFIIGLSQQQNDRLKVGATDRDTLDAAQTAITQLGQTQEIEVHLIDGHDPTQQSYDIIQHYYNELTSENYRAVIGRCDFLLATASGKIGIPYLTTSVCDHMTEEMTRDMLQLIPDFPDIIESILSLVRFYSWEKVAIFHQRGLASAHITQLFIELPDVELHLWQVSTGEDQTNQIRQDLMQMRQFGMKHSLLIVSSSLAHTILRQARALGILAQPYAWIVLNMGGENDTVGLLQYLYTNFTTIQVADKSGACAPTPGRLSCLEDLVINDGIHALAEAKSMANNHLKQALRNVKFWGKTGMVSFNDRGHRQNFSLSIFHYINESFNQVGRWYKLNDTGKLDCSGCGNWDEGELFSDVIQNQHFRFVTILEQPWVMRSEDEHWSGFAVDLLAEIAKHLQFTYDLYLVPDGKFGSREEDGKWNGMIGQILSGNASMSIAPLSINADREEAIDFTHHFKTRSITVLVKTPESQTSFFEFMRPLSSMVWLVVLVALVVFSVSLYYLEKYNEAHQNILPKLDRATESTWFIFGSLSGGGSESSPTTIPGRIASSAWYFFALILISTYTANLAAFLTVKKINPPISSVGDLVQQSRIKYGTVSNSGVENFFFHSTIEPFKSMYERMQLMEDTMVNSTEQGLERVKGGDYAFLWDSTVNTYYALTDCSYTQVGPSFDSKGFGIGVPSRSKFLSSLNKAILTLSDNGKISELEHRYWGMGKCAIAANKNTEETEELDLDSLAGIFIVLCAGLVIAAVAMAIEKCIRHCHRQAKKKRGKRLSNGVRNQEEEEHL